MNTASDELPLGWCWARLEELTPADAPIVYGIILPGPHVEGGVPFIRPIDITDGTVEVSALPRTSSEIAAKYRRASLQAGDLVFSIVGTIGKWLIVSEELSGANITQSSVRIRPLPPVSAKFLLCLLQSPMVSAQIHRLLFGNAVQRLNVEHVRGLATPVPPLNEQRRILERIDDLQARSRKVRLELEAIPPLLEQYRLSVLAAAFRGDLTAEWREQHPDAEPASVLLGRIQRELRERLETTNARQRSVELQPVENEDLPELPVGWCWVRFGDMIAELRNGIGTKPEFEPPGQSILRINAVRPGCVLFDDLRYLRGEFDSSYLIADGDILFTRYNGSLELLGVCGVVRGLGSQQLLYPDKLMRVRIGHTGLIPEYVEAFFSTPQVRRRIELKAKSSAGQQGISGQDIKDQFVSLPPLEEQREIARLVAETQVRVSQTHQLVSEAMADLQVLEQSVLAQAFRGELVKQDPADEPASVLLERIRTERNGTARTVAVSNSQNTAKLLVTRYLVMLLRTWNKKAARETLETCIVLMLNDDARRAILGKKPTAKAKSKKATTGRTHMPGLDHLLGELVTASFLAPPETVKGKQVFGIGPKAPFTADIKAALSDEDERRLKETLQALEAFGEERARLELDAVSHATYELVS